MGYEGIHFGPQNGDGSCFLVWGSLEFGQEGNS